MVATLSGIAVSGGMVRAAAAALFDIRETPFPLADSVPLIRVLQVDAAALVNESALGGLSHLYAFLARAQGLFVPKLLSGHCLLLVRLIVQLFILKELAVLLLSGGVLNADRIFLCLDGDTVCHLRAGT